MLLPQNKNMGSQRPLSFALLTFLTLLCFQKILIGVEASNKESSKVCFMNYYLIAMPRLVDFSSFFFFFFFRRRVICIACWHSKVPWPTRKEICSGLPKKIYLVVLFFWISDQVYIVYLGEKKHEDPDLVTASHHEILASLLGR